MRNSAIQWTDDTVNPVAGCDGCELFPTVAVVRRRIVDALTPQIPVEWRQELRVRLVPTFFTAIINDFIGVLKPSGVSDLLMAEHVDVLPLKFQPSVL